MKRNLGNTVHVTRGYGYDHKYGIQRNIHLEGENYKVEIRKFDRNFDMIYTINNMSHENLYVTKWRNLDCLLHAPIEINGGVYDNSESYIELEYNCIETGSYMIDFLYFNEKYEDKDCYCYISVSDNGEEFIEVNQSCEWTGDDNNMSRHSQVFTFIEGHQYTIKYENTPNTGIIGAIIKKYDIYYGTRYNKGDLTIDNINIKINDKVQPNEATVSIWYNHDLDDTSNLSGYLFDYRDEINIYKKDSDDSDFTQVFGGYITNVDDNEVESNMILKLNCADRLIDGENRFCLQEIVMLGGETDEKGQAYSKDSFRSYNSRGDVLDYLTNIYELPLFNNNILQSDYFQKNFGYRYWYDKTSCPSISATNMTYVKGDKCVTIRNGSQVDTNNDSYDAEGNEPQSITILDTSSTGDIILLNNNPNFWIQYGLGEKEWKETVKHTVIDTTSTVNGKKHETYQNIDFISDKVRKFADKVTKEKDEACVKPLWKAISKFTHEYTSGFNRTPESVIEHKLGNCCSKSRLLAECLAYKEVGGIYYVHIKNGNKLGHVFLKLARYNKKANFYVDPSYKQEKNGWGNYGHYNGASVTKNLKHMTEFPKKPL